MLTTRTPASVTTHRLSIIIPTFNESPHIAAAIASARDAGADEILVIDGGSTDDTAAIAARCGATVRHGAAGRGRQLALGGREATGDWLLFLHADNVLHRSDGGRNVREQLSDAGWPVWGGLRQRIDATGLAFRWLEWGNATRVRSLSRVFGDQAMFVQRTTYEHVGGFQEIDLMEDVRLSQLLKSHSPAVLLDGPVGVSARRWQARGVMRQTARNWSIQIAHACGVGPTTLRRWYG